MARNKNLDTVMINKKYFHYVFVAIMAMSMTLVLSFIATAKSEGLSGQFLVVWLIAAGLGFSVAFPTALIISPLAKWAATRLTTEQ